MNELYQNIVKDLIEIYSLVNNIQESDWDIEDVLDNIEDIQNKYEELSEEGTMKYEQSLP